jgi:hypothetical protein
MICSILRINDNHFLTQHMVFIMETDCVSCEILNISHMNFSLQMDYTLLM